MVFSHVTFLFGFLPLVLGLYLLAPRAARNPCLLAASLLFYAWGESLFVLLMLSSIAANYAFGLWVDRARGTRAGPFALCVAVAGNLAPLAWFKYAGFAAVSLDGLTRLLGLGEIRLDPSICPSGSPSTPSRRSPTSSTCTGGRSAWSATRSASHSTSRSSRS